MSRHRPSRFPVTLRQLFRILFLENSELSLRSDFHLKKKKTAMKGLLHLVADTHWWRCCPALTPACFFRIPTATTLARHLWTSTHTSTFTCWKFQIWSASLTPLTKAQPASCWGWGSLTERQVLVRRKNYSSASSRREWEWRCSE